MKLIHESQEVKDIFPDFGDFEFEVSFSLQGGRCVWRDLYNEYEQVKSAHEIINKIIASPDILVCYRVFPSRIIPMFQKFSDGKLFSKLPPKKIQDRSPIQGAAPWEYNSDNTIFAIKRTMKNEYFGPTDIRLIVGGFDKKDSVTRWRNLNSIFARSNYT